MSSGPRHGQPYGYRTMKRGLKPHHIAAMDLYAAGTRGVIISKRIGISGATLAVVVTTIRNTLPPYWSKKQVGEWWKSEGRALWLPSPKCIIIESPFAGDVERNLRYLRAAMRDSLGQNEAPFASHGLYTQPGVLDDTIPAQRTLGIQAGFAWREHAALTAFYVDLGWTPGMKLAKEDCEKRQLKWEGRRLLGEWTQEP